MITDKFLLCYLVKFLTLLDIDKFYKTSFYFKSIIKSYNHFDYKHVYNSLVFKHYPDSIWLMDQNTYIENGKKIFRLIPCLKCRNFESIQTRPLDQRKYYRSVICPRINRFVTNLNN